MSFHPNLRSFEAYNRCSSNITLHLTQCIFPSTLTNFLMHVEEKPPCTMILPPQCFTVGMVCSRLYAALVSLCSHLTRPSFTCLPTWLVALLQTWLLYAFTKQCCYFCHSSIRRRLMTCTRFLVLFCSSRVMILWVCLGSTWTVPFLFSDDALNKGLVAVQILGYCFIIIKHFNPFNISLQLCLAGVHIGWWCYFFPSVH